MRGAANFFVCEAEELLSGLPAGLVFFADPRSLLCLESLQLQLWLLREAVVR